MTDRSADAHKPIRLYGFTTIEIRDADDHWEIVGNDEDGVEVILATCLCKPIVTDSDDLPPPPAPVSRMSSPGLTLIADQHQRKYAKG